MSLRLGAGGANDLLVTQYWRGRSTFFQFLITSKILKGGGSIFLWSGVCVGIRGVGGRGRRGGGVKLPSSSLPQSLLDGRIILTDKGQNL